MIHLEYHFVSWIELGHIINYSFFGMYNASFQDTISFLLRLLF